MFFEHRAFWLAKDAAHPETSQDAFDADAVRGIASLADGVSSSLFAGSWAEILASAVVVDPPQVTDPAAMHQWLARRRQTWRAPIDESALAWHQKPKMAAGAFSTLLWVELSAGSGAGTQLRAYAVGDGCLFHVRDGQVRRAFPIEDSRLFDVDPDVLGSVAGSGDREIAFQTLQDECLPGDLLALCTDAVAAWALRELEAGRSPDWQSQWTMPFDAWKQWVSQLRASDQMRFDDATLVLLRISEPLPGRRGGGWLDRLKESLPGG